MGIGGITGGIAVALSPTAHAPSGTGQWAQRHLHGERGDRRVGGVAEQRPGPALPRHQLRAVG